MPRKPIKVVFDCNIVWQAFFSESGAAGKCKSLVDEGKLTLYLNLEILDEIRDVLTRPETQARFAQATDEAVDAYLADLAGKSIIIRSVPQTFSYSRDPDDEPYLNLAIEAKADYIVSRDKDLLDLMTSYTDEGKDFRRRFRPLRVIAPKEFLSEIGKANSESGEG